MKLPGNNCFQILLKIIFTLFFSFIFLVSCKKESDEEIVAKFFNLRKEGSTEAWNFVDEETKKWISFEEFKEYCFIYRVTEFKINEKNVDSFIKVDYSFVDKKFKKNSKNELHTFYISENYEYLKLKNGKIIFPHPLFINLRKAIEEGNLEKAKTIVEKMLKISPNQPDVLETAKNMELL